MKSAMTKSVYSWWVALPFIATILVLSNYSGSKKRPVIYSPVPNYVSDTHPRCDRYHFELVRK
jgi:hypothetical protein